MLVFRAAQLGQNLVIIYINLIIKQYKKKIIILTITIIIFITEYIKMVNKNEIRNIIRKHYCNIPLQNKKTGIYKNNIIKILLYYITKLIFMDV